jgi:hypothetical protein
VIHNAVRQQHMIIEINWFGALPTSKHTSSCGIPMTVSSPATEYPLMSSSPT